MKNHTVIKMSKIFLRETDDINKALRKFKNKVEQSGVLKDLQKKEFYEKPTTKRKRKKSAAKARYKKELERQQLPQKYF
jgi:small subunit ribosomal protein S21